MSFDIAMRAIQLAMKDGKPTGILFYGGEPLLEKKLITQIVEETQKIKEKTKHNFHYKMTTNGILLEEEFLKMSKAANLMIGLSHDGYAQDDNRLFSNGSGTFHILEEKIDLLLQYQPYAIGLSVVNPPTVEKAAQTVEFLYNKGFKYITVGTNYDRKAPWTNERMLLLGKEYEKIAQMYMQWMRNEEKIYVSTMDMKILSHLKGEKYISDRRLQSKNQISVGADGLLYPVSKYLEQPEFEVGDVFSGLDETKREQIFNIGAELSPVCKDCKIKTRCNHAYDNIRFEDGKYISDITPVQCTHERLVTPIVDRAAEKLYKEGSPLFLHKHYNEMYPILSLFEDIMT